MLQNYIRYNARIERAVEGAFVWSLKSPLAQPDHTLADPYWRYLRPLAPNLGQYGGALNRISGPLKLRKDSQDFRFISVIAFYFLNYKVTDDSEHIEKLTKNHWLWNELLDRYTPTTGHEDEPKLAILQYFDALCWQSLRSKLPEASPLDDEASTNHIEALGRRAKTWARPNSKNEADEYNKDDQALDHLILLIHEVFPDRADLLKEQTFGRIEQRISTQTIKPGEFGDERFQMMRYTTQAPWELECLNHHITLKVATMDILKLNDIKRCKDLCTKFFLLDFTFAPTYSRSNPECLEKLWHTTPSAIVAGTLLSLEARSQGISKVTIVFRFSTYATCR